MIFKVLILLTCTVNVRCSVTVKLYSGQNYSGLLRKVIVNQNNETECIQLDQTYEVRSLKTDKCIIVYETGHCKRIDKPTAGSTMYSVRVEGDTALFDIDAAYSNRKEERGVQSFHVCGTEPFLNVDIYSGTYYTGDLVASYHHVCECKNVPSYLGNGLKGKEFSINNHGTNMYFYDKEDCRGQERLIPAGDNERSRFVFHLDTRAVVIRSFRPAGLPCPKLDATVYKFYKFSHGKHTIVSQDQHIAYILTNRQHTTVTEEIKFYDTLTAEYFVAKAFTYIHTTRVKAGVLVSSYDDLVWRLNEEGALQSSLEAHYKYPNTNQSTPANATIRWPVTPKKVDKPPCTACTVDIYFHKQQQNSIVYTAEATVTGVAGDDKVSAEQIRHFLPPGMKYVKKSDDYSVVVSVEGEMKLDFVFCDSISSETSCMPLPDCSRSEL